MSFKANLQGIDELCEALEEIVHMSREFTSERHCLSNDLLRDIVNPYFRRSFVRLECARLEGMTACMKRVAIAGAAYSGATFSNSELEILREDRFVSTIKNCDVCWRCFRRSLSVGEAEHHQAVNWNVFGDALKIRNRVVHPKKVADLEISESDIMLFVEGLTWFVASTVELANEANKNLRAITRQKKIYRRETTKVGRNELCQCGSGKKHKHCHGR